MQVAFRVDASLQIGTGHVMRCITLAHALRDNGVQCVFYCRLHEGHLLDVISQQGFETVALSVDVEMTANIDTLAHSHWLGTDWLSDAKDTQLAMGHQIVDWLVVDHYALDARWERVLMPNFRRLLVIDDIADREHISDVLLDQNMVNLMNERYKSKVPDKCICLLGPKYGLLRPEFNQFRSASIIRRTPPKLEKLLIFMGGSDPEIETIKVVEGVKLSKKKWRQIDVVVGQNFPAIDVLRKRMVDLPKAYLHIQTPDMANLMLKADLAITAGGIVTWEKCALGLPSLVAIQGDNQLPIANRMHELGVQLTLGLAEKLIPIDYAGALDEIQPEDLVKMSKSCQDICDGSGISAVLNAMDISK